MSEIQLDTTLRPIRFLFLIKPNDKKNLEKIFQLNTLLWGGRFNPIVPFFKKVPNWWGNNHQKYNATQILNNYLDVFEPDFIVETESEMMKDIIFDKKRILSLNNVLNIDSLGVDEKYGLSVKDWYSHLYEKKYQFERRYKPNFINAKAKTKNSKLLSACLSGSFLTENKLSFFKQWYVDIFEAKEIELEPQFLSDLYNEQYITPLDITHGNMEVRYSIEAQRPKIFILDLNASRDLIDYWNLRIIYKNIVVIPKQWMTDLASFCNEYITKNYNSRITFEHEYLYKTTIMFSRSISEPEGKEILNNYLLKNTNKISVQFFYPDFSPDYSNAINNLQRPLLSYKKEKQEVSFYYENNRRQVQFATLSPDFVKEKYHHTALWANVIEIKDWRGTSHISTCFPTNYRNPIYPKFGFYREFILPTLEGLTTFPESVNENYFWSFPNGTEATQEWLNALEIKSKVSDAGKATQQIIETLGGVLHIYALANKGIVEKLDEMARKLLTGSFHSNKFKNQIKNVSNEGRANLLIAKNVVQIGLELKCSKCDSWSWYKVSDLDYELNCNRCLKNLHFPVTEPTNNQFSRWSYRVIGAFALPDYARGGYSASLAIHFFIRKFDFSHRLKITWSSGQELTFPTGEKAETDFILWSQNEEIINLNRPTEIIFGEAKSFAKDSFKEDDFTKMRLIAEKFPKSIIVFASMKSIDQFSQDELDRLREFSEWGRGYNTINKEVRAYVMVLTGLELFIDDYRSVKNLWEDKGGKYQEFAHKLRASSDLKLFAEMTQQLYLDMPSYYEGLRVS